jgi:hypothetical protein
MRSSYGHRVHDKPKEKKQIVIEIIVIEVNYKKYKLYYIFLNVVTLVTHPFAALLPRQEFIK